MQLVDDLWLDAVLCVPVVGIQMKVPASIAVRLREVVAPALDQLASISDLEIAHSSGQGATELRVTGKDGFVHKVVQGENGCHAAVEFAFAPVETRTVGKLPSMKYELQSYTQLSKECLRRVEILTSPLLKSSGVRMMRVGLAATAELALAQLPPGFLQYKEWTERPWKKKGGTVGKLQTSILVRLTSTDEHQDQCHHALGYEHAQDETEYRLMLDYQRVFAKPPARNAADLGAFSSKAKEYFQSFAFPEARSWE